VTRGIARPALLHRPPLRGSKKKKKKKKEEREKKIRVPLLPGASAPG